MAANTAITDGIEELCTIIKDEIETITAAGGAVTVDYFEMSSARDQHILETIMALLVDLGDVDVETGTHYRLHPDEDTQTE